MRYARLVCGMLFPLLLAPSIQAQRVSQLEPGTLIRVRTLSGERLVGPLAEVRGDSVFLSSTPTSADAAVSFRSIADLEYADGSKSGYTLLGAVIGAALSISLAQAGAGESDSGCHTCWLSYVLVLPGTILGAVIGSEAGGPNWVTPTRPLSSVWPSPRAQPALAIAFRF
jgi:hypothetical protein